MKKIIVLFAILVSVAYAVFIPKVYCHEIKVGDVYIINNGSFVPVFNRISKEFEYETGLHGNNCYALETVLLPNFSVKINGVYDQDNYEIISTPNNSYKIEGFVHRHFIENDMTFIGRQDLSGLTRTISAPSVKEISELLREVSKSGCRYCYGCNSPKEIKLNEFYSFKQADDIGIGAQRFSCSGFDSSGLLHYVSNGYLPHDTYDLLKFGKKLFVLDRATQMTQELLKEILFELKDTDVVFFHSKSDENSQVFGHAIIAYRFGFIESRGQNYGIVITPPYDAESRLFNMYKCAKEIGVNLYVIRWHPSLLRSSQPE